MNRHRTYVTHRIALGSALAFVFAVLAACAPTATTGTLQIVVVGLPSGTAADLTVGTQAVTASTSLSLPTGAHEVAARPVLATASIMGDRYAPDQSSVDATVTAGGTTTVTITYVVAQQALLLVPSFGDAVNVLTVDDLVGGGAASSAWTTATTPGGQNYNGMALGPDGRLYVTERSGDQILVIDAADLAADGSVTPAAVITNAGLTRPVGAAFDSQGRLWVGSSNGGLLRFDGVLGRTGAVDVAPALVVSVDDTTFATAFNEIYDVFVDHSDRVWVVDYGTEAVYRFDGLAEATGAQTVVPDLFLVVAVSAVSGSGFTLNAPNSLVVDDEGTLYVGNLYFEVSRFDDASALSGFQNPEASAYLDTGFDQPLVVALDQSGALWVGHYDGELVRLADPTNATGYADVSGDLDLQLTWYTEGGDGYPDGGRLTFVPTQGRHAGY